MKLTGDSDLPTAVPLAKKVRHESEKEFDSCIK